MTTTDWPPIYEQLVEELALDPFDPDRESAFEFMNWNLNDIYPISIGELMLSITALQEGQDVEQQA